MVTLETFKKYARLDSTATDAKMFLDAAIQHALDAGIPRFLFEIEDPKLKLYICSIADHMYENRAFGLADTSCSDEYIEKEKQKMRTELKYRRPEYCNLTAVGFGEDKGNATVMSRGKLVAPGDDALMLYNTASIVIAPESGYEPGACTCGIKPIALTYSEETNVYTAANIKIMGDISLVLQEAE